MIQTYSRENPSVAWCATVIRNAASHAKIKQTRTSQNELLCLNNVNEDGVELIDLYKSDLAEIDFQLIDFSSMLSILPRIQFLIMYRLYVLFETQTEIARKLNISQQQVSRLRNRAIKTLRMELIQA